MPRHFLTGEELAAEELAALLDRALELKAERVARLAVAGARDAGEAVPGALAGRSVALIFDKPSTRTRVSFEVAERELSGHAVVLREGETQLARGESPRDTALVLSRLVHAIGIRTAAHSIVTELARHAAVPVVNLLTGEHHPCQALGDLLTLRERFGRTAGLRLGYVGDGNNVAHSLMLLGARAGMEVAVATPPELAPDPAIAQAALDEAATGGGIVLAEDPLVAAEGAHAVYADVWLSMADDEGEAARRRELLAPYRLDGELLGHASADAVALHCLPAHPGEEIAEDVLYGERSAVWEQAENRLHAQKALLELLVGG